MRFLPLTVLIFALALQSASAQEPAAEIAVHHLDGWETVLPSGTLQPQPDIIAVDGGFAVAAASFVAQGARLDSTWLRYDPVSGNWSKYEFPQAEQALLDLNEELLTLLDISDLVPDDPRIKYQLVDAGRKLAFLIPDVEFYEGLGLYTTVLIIDPARKNAKGNYVWYCQGPPNAELVVWDFPDQDMSVICNAIFHHDSDSTRTERTFAFIGRNQQSALHLISHSPDHRYWVLGEKDIFFEDPGPFYVYDRQTGLSTVMLWRLPGKLGRDFVLWLNNHTLMAKADDFILYLDMTNRTRHELLRRELALLPGDAAYKTPTLSRDGRWLVATSVDGSLFLRQIPDAPAE
ncbi:MAG: hypothetical protein OXG53_06415 [Chloroflexi bacterium]|nr:hypothetical protein [Chloroflexota bacterium]